MTFTRRTCIALALVALVSVPATAWAEAGDGLRTGSFTLTPGVSLSGAFDSNVFFLADAEQETVSAPSLILEPFMRIETEEDRDFDLNFDGSVAWQQYVNDDERVSEQSGLAMDAGLGMTFNQTGTFSLHLEDRLTRTNEPPSNPSEVTFNRLLNRAGATLGFHPGGKVFQHYLSADWMRYLHDELEDLDRSVYNFTLKNYWRFLPKTAAVLTADFSMIRYDEPFREGLSNVPERALVNIDSNPLRLTGGLTGLITNRLGLRLAGGYGNSFSESGPSYSSYLADVQLQYMFGRLSAKNRLYSGYERGFQDATISSFASYHRFYAGYEQLIVDRLRLKLEGGSTLRDYEGAPVGSVSGPSGPVTIPELNDLLVGGVASADFALYKWWSLGLSYRFQANYTDDRIETGLPAGDALREYTRHFVMFGTTVHY